MKCVITGLIIAAVVGSAALAGETKQFPASPGWLSWLRLDYPERFEMDTKSLQGEAKWWAKFNDKESEFSFKIIAFGCVNNLDLAVIIPSITYENYPDKLCENLPIERVSYVLVDSSSEFRIKICDQNTLSSLCL